MLFIIIKKILYPNNSNEISRNCSKPIILADTFETNFEIKQEISEKYPHITKCWVDCPFVNECPAGKEVSKKF